MAGASTISIRPIHTEADYEDALAEVAALMDAQPGTEEGDRLDILATLVEAYETRHHPIGPPDPIEAIKYRMEQQGMTSAALRPYIGSSGRMSEILQRKRPLTLHMIRRLVKLGISAGVLILPTGAPSIREAKAGTAAARKVRAPRYWISNLGETSRASQITGSGGVAVTRSNASWSWLITTFRSLGRPTIEGTISASVRRSS